MKSKLKFLRVLFLISILILPYIGYCQTFNTDLVFIKGGKFKIGSKIGDDDEKGGKKIYINDFYISKFEVTNAQFCDFLNHKNPNASELMKYISLSGEFENLTCRIYQKDSLFHVEKGFGNYPVYFVSWFGAEAYCKFAGGRLPTEAEWEYVAKGGKTSFFDKLFVRYQFSGSNNPGELAWYRNNSKEKPHPVGQKKPNKLNVFDMCGNLAEWCSDWYLPDYYKHSSEKNPQGPEIGRLKVHRGGSWYNTPDMLRITNRRASKPLTENATIGFRFVKDVN